MAVPGPFRRRTITTAHNLPVVLILHHKSLTCSLQPNNFSMADNVGIFLSCKDLDVDAMRCPASAKVACSNTKHEPYQHGLC
jgi:hypothetical protein